MSSVLIIGVILSAGFFMGELVQRFRLPRITGYILAGIVLNPQQKKIFTVLERYQEELVFVFFFTLSSMHLDLSVMPAAAPYIALFVLLRTMGKTLGAYSGALVSGAAPKVRRYTFLGLLPQGGIVIGLALIMHRSPDFGPIADLVMAIVIGSTIIHEIAGPIVSRIGLQKAGEIPA